MDDTHPILTNILSLANPATWQAAIDLADQGVTAWLSGLDHCNFSRIYFTGCGTSFFNGQVGKSLIEHLAHIPAEAAPAFSFTSYAEAALLGPRTLVVGISTGGDTKSVCDGLGRAHQAGSATLALTAFPGTAVTKLADAAILTGGHSDQMGVKTSSYVQALVVISILAARLAGSSAVMQNWLEQVKLAAQGAAAYLAEQRGQIEQLAQTYAKANNVFILGSGPNLGTAEEGSLKVIEMAKMYSECQELEDFFHGRLREVDQDSPMFFIAPSGPCIPRLLDFLTVTHHIGAPSVVLTDRANPAIQELATHVVQLPVVLDEIATPLLYIIPLYLFGYEMALQRGYDPLARRYNLVPQKVRWGEKL
jgi:glucosamine--fructose-6-phosphate aminotransferase (isomerizing)